jgi:stage II sporulation protein M
MVFPTGMAAVAISETPKVSFVAVFINNTVICAVGLVGSLLTFGLAGVFIILLNGVMLGSVLGSLSTSEILAGILPHGILEITGMLMMQNAGLVLLASVIFRVTHIKGGGLDLRSAIGVVWKMSMGGVLMLLVAAIIESTITVFLLNLVR